MWRRKINSDVNNLYYDQYPDRTASRYMHLIIMQLVCTAISRLMALMRMRFMIVAIGVETRAIVCVAVCNIHHIPIPTIVITTANE